jgi:hypothetical protein
LAIGVNGKEHAIAERSTAGAGVRVDEAGEVV